MIDMERSFRGREVTRHGGGATYDRHGKIFQRQGVTRHGEGGGAT